MTQTIKNSELVKKALKDAADILINMPKEEFDRLMAENMKITDEDFIVDIHHNLAETTD
jgi:hypothetical protein